MSPVEKHPLADRKCKKRGLALEVLLDCSEIPAAYRPRKISTAVSAGFSWRRVGRVALGTRKIFMESAEKFSWWRKIFVPGAAKV